MSCNNCNSNNSYFQLPNTNCTNLTTKCIPTDSSCVIYTGPALTCLSLPSNTSVEQIIQAVDSIICSVGGIPWNTFDYSCLTEPLPDGFGLVINDAQSFAEGVSSAICDTKQSVDNLETIMEAAIDNLTLVINDNNTPGPITGCALFSLTGSDTVATAFIKTKDAFCYIGDLLDDAVTIPDWEQCFAVAPLPTNLWQAFDVLIDQICTLKGQIDSFTPTLPTFNNIGTCLATPTATDSLYDTIIKLRTYTCALPTYDDTNIVWTQCLANPGPNLEDAINLIVARLQVAYEKRVVTFDPTYFSNTLVTPLDPCSGHYISIIGGFTDQLVKLNAGDPTANYLLNKITAGTNISFDTITTPGTVIINANDDHKVKADTSDTLPDFLIDKVTSQNDVTGSLNLNIDYDAFNQKVRWTPVFNMATLSAQILNTISGNPGLLAQYCSMVCGCQPCSTTTTTTTAAVNAKKITFIWGRPGSDPESQVMNSRMVATQTSPGLTFYDTGMVALTQAQTITSGVFTVTMTTPPTGNITLYMGTNPFEVGYNVYVKDAFNNTPIGSGTATGGVSSGGNTTLSSFAYGDDSNGLFVYIELLFS